MSFVVTLIADPDGAVLTPALAHKAAAAVRASDVVWLRDDVACDILIDPDANAGDVAPAIRAALGDSPIDVAVVPVENRRKKLLLADMDSTMIEQECIDELADEIGVKEKVAGITRRAMNGEIEFEPALLERVALLKGLPVSVIADVIEKRIALASGARTLVATMRANGAWTALISGGFDAFTGPVGQKIGFDEQRANRLLEKDGRLTGDVARPVLGREAKAAALREIAAAHGLVLDDTTAVGDGANDLDMIRLAGAGVALHAKPSVAAQAPIRIDHGDLAALLYLQGYRFDEFVR